MAGQLMLLNPRKRRKSRKRRSPAQLAATRKLVALNRRRGGAKRRPAKRRTARRSPARRRNPVSYAAPRRRRRRATGLAGLGGLPGLLMPAAMGATGALALDIAWGMLPIPAQFKTGPFIAPAVKIGGALGIGWLASMVATKKTADQVMVGAITVTIFNIARTFVANTFPQVTLGNWNEETIGFVNAGQFQADPLIGEYVDGYVPDYETRESAGMAEYVSGYDAYGN